MSALVRKIDLEDIKDELVEAHSKIFFTTDYGKFGWIAGNRLLEERKIKKICQSNHAGINLFPYVPILVTKKFKVVDGQHRLMCAKSLGVPIYYMIVDDYTVSQIARINANTTSWKVKDYLNCWINLERQDYIELEKFMKEYSFPVSTAADLLSLEDIKDGSNRGVMDDFRDGSFKIANYDNALKVARAYKEYLEIFEKEKSRLLLRTVIILMGSDKYDHDEVIQKLISTGAKIMDQANTREFISHIELLFNKGNQKRKLLF